MTTDSEKAFTEWYEKPGRNIFDFRVPDIFGAGFKEGQAYGEQQAIERVLAVIDAGIKDTNEEMHNACGSVRIITPCRYKIDTLTNLRNEIQEGV